ncbi:MAG TPA: PfkB family carbohydrate kinase, partial [Actinomycetota bacterium]
VLRELTSSGVGADALVGSARDAGERVEVGALSRSVPVPLIVRTEGVDGGSFTTSDGVEARYPAVPAAAAPDDDADAYGAGDSFAAGLTFALGQGTSIIDALTLAARCGAACAAGAGPYARQLTVADI